MGSSSHPAPHTAQSVGVVFDIDGVVLRGYDRLPHARESLLRLADAGIPFVFLTNGGGEVEEVKRGKLAKVLGLPLEEDQVILSHTPLKDRCAEYADKRVLVLGCRDVVGVARSYGLRRVLTVRQLCEEDPTRYPFIHYEKRALPAPHEKDEPFAAVFILHDPNDWAPEIQVTLDILLGGLPLGSGKGVVRSAGYVPANGVQAVPLFSSNPDLLFAGIYSVPRLAAGSYTVALRAVWKAVTGTELDVVQYGKPHKVTYDFAAKRLAQWGRRAAAEGWHAKALDAAETMKPASGGLSWAVVDPHVGGAGNPHSQSHQVKQQTHTHTTGGDASSHAQHARFDRIFMVGDNPRADIKGANDAGAPWHSILVRTGVFSGPPGSNDPTNPAKDVVQGIKDAVDIVLAAKAGGRK
jgi:HAD superfamily hydrolase (TIGR01456 family)